MALFPDELEADLQQHYGIDIERAAAGEHSARHVAALAVQLPQTARVWVAQDPDNVWGLRETLLAALVNQVRATAHGLAGGSGEISYVGPSDMKNAGRKRLPAMVMTKEELMAELSKRRIAKVGD